MRYKLVGTSLDFVRLKNYVCFIMYIIIIKTTTNGANGDACPDRDAFLQREFGAIDAIHLFLYIIMRTYVHQQRLYRHTNGSTAILHRTNAS